MDRLKNELSKLEKVPSAISNKNDPECYYQYFYVDNGLIGVHMDTDTFTVACFDIASNGNFIKYYSFHKPFFSDGFQTWDFTHFDDFNKAVAYCFGWRDYARY